MRKLYFIVSIPATAKDRVITGVVANGTGRHATAEEVTALIELLRTKGATPSLLDSLRDATYPGLVSAFERRAAARAEADILNSFNRGGLFNWHIIEVGESIRKPVRKPLGWELGFVVDGKWMRSAWNDESTTGLVNTEKGTLFGTRAAAREAMSKAWIADEIRPVYADA
ncbi:hypothetical protein P4_00042 [Xanthomonas phage P4]|uniref:Uncharacterized protein n=1 Tax=Xanthomonas phage P4 TaxID=3003372 RepID=A0AAE9VI91_9CAUD|nr:hypothetical protein P4_00042 [Xanthomonas phage P4]